MAINDALLHLQQDCITATFSADDNWLHARRDELQKFAGEKYVAVCPSTTHLIPGVIYLEKRYDAGLCEDPSGINIRGTSGYGALNLAYLKGAKRIVLLGYDFKYGGGPSHWYDDKVQVADDWLVQQWADEFEGTLKQLREARIQVINASPNSKIRAFRKTEVAKVL